MQIFYSTNKNNTKISCFFICIQSPNNFKQKMNIADTNQLSDFYANEIYVA